MNVQHKTSKRHKGTGFPALYAFFSFKAALIFILLNLSVLTNTGSAQTQEDTGQSFIVLKSKESIYGKVELKSPLFGSEYLLFNDTAKYSIQQIRAFQNDQGYFANLHTGGYYGTQKLVKRTQTGKVNLFTTYQMYSTAGSWNSMMTPGGRVTYYNPGTTTLARFDYFSKDTNDILPASRDNLMAALSDNPKSIQLLREHKNLGVAKIVLVLAGLGLIGSAFIGVDKDHPPSVELMVAGGIVANLSWIPYFMQAGKIENAIEVYNSK
ncbi:hypothetical protein JNM05_04700 [bacterium]|nr:hypothetical protein [bacterium]